MIVFVDKQLSKTPQENRTEVYSIAKAISAFWNRPITRNKGMRNTETSYQLLKRSNEETRAELL